MNHTLAPVTKSMLQELRRDELYTLIEGEQNLRKQMQEELDLIKSRYSELEESVLDIQGKFVRLKAKIFGRSSEKLGPKKGGASDSRGKNGRQNQKREKFSKLPSERYPNAPIIEKDLSLVEPPICSECHDVMQDSGMRETTEYLTVEPRKFTIIRQHRHKYRCRCHSSIQTTPQLPRIKLGSAYSDDMIIDIAMSKYCDLIPIERYAQMAAREGFAGLPANSLIEATHHLAKFLFTVYMLIKSEILAERVLRADETPHKMLEGDKSKNWFLWGFSTENAAFFACKNTRSGDVASSFLEHSSAEVLLSDVYSGYAKALRIVNNCRLKKDFKILKAAYCNAHSRRKFKEAEASFPEQAALYLRNYRVIYKLEDWGQKTNKVQKNRKRMKWIFAKMLALGQEHLKGVSEKSELARAIKYFSKNYEGLTLFLSDDGVGIDNNPQERLMRNPVVGRKTWYGTHSKRGAETASILFTIIETCKLNKVNPRKYVKAVVASMHRGKAPVTPFQFKHQEEV